MGSLFSLGPDCLGPHSPLTVRRLRQLLADAVLRRFSGGFFLFFSFLTLRNLCVIRTVNNQHNRPPPVSPMRRSALIQDYDGRPTNRLNGNRGGCQCQCRVNLQLAELDYKWTVLILALNTVTK